MLEDLEEAVIDDLNYTPPLNYLKGAGDTYFSGKDYYYTKIKFFN
jgi:hypothetical protein